MAIGYEYAYVLKNEEDAQVVSEFIEVDLSEVTSVAGVVSAVLAPLEKAYADAVENGENIQTNPDGFLSENDERKYGYRFSIPQEEVLALGLEDDFS